MHASKSHDALVQCTNEHLTYVALFAHHLKLAVSMHFVGQIFGCFCSEVRSTVNI